MKKRKKERWCKCELRANVNYVQMWTSSTCYHESLNCFKVYRVFKGTRWSVRCAQTCEVRLVGKVKKRKKERWCKCELRANVKYDSLNCLKVHRVFKGTRCSVRCAHTCKVHIRTIYADTVEHARLFKSISSVQRYSLQRSMRANMRGSSAAYTCT